ncbi:hypothetical protein MTCD1_03267 [Colwellia marinimaniae]|uniref:Uncharacterized protein n=1 Tax=Colwellia marinimaniae TaxID=1513592 RepID=A0ABQ0MZ73_9GAMM|nr:hypothetical protein MTCD1_03267 [Colwellia marinimaniae]
MQSRCQLNDDEIEVLMQLLQIHRFLGSFCCEILSLSITGLIVKISISTQHLGNYFIAGQGFNACVIILKSF